MATIKLTDDYEALDLQIGKMGETLSSIVFKLDTTVADPIYLYLYAPNGDYLGGIWNAMTTMPTFLILGTSFWSLNGKRTALVGGFYSVVMTGMRQTGQSIGTLSYESDLSLEACRRFTGPLPSGYLLYESTLQKMQPKMQPKMQMGSYISKLKQEEAILIDDKMNAEEAKVRTQAELTLFKGDFHSHTHFSDGHMNYAEAAEAMAKQALDFIALTEHNAIDLNEVDFGVPVIPSFELTLPKGHFNIHGIPRTAVISEAGRHYLNTIDTREAMTTSRLLELYRPDAFITLNHMFMAPWHCQDGELEMQLIDAIEIICDPTYPTAASANDRAVQFLDFLWRKGVHIFGIGGSDCHNRRDEPYEGSALPSVYGDPATYVYSESIGPEAILKHVSQGHMIVARFVQLTVDINAGSILPGQCFSMSEVVQIHYAVTIDWPETYAGIAVTTLLKGAACQFIINGEIAKTMPLVKGVVCQMTVDADLAHPFWMRFGIVDGGGHVIAYVNPICNRREKTARKTYNTYLEEFNNSND